MVSVWAEKGCTGRTVNFYHGREVHMQCQKGSCEQGQLLTPGVPKHPWLYTDIAISCPSCSTWYPLTLVYSMSLCVPFCRPWGKLMRGSSTCTAPTGCAVRCKPWTQAMACLPWCLASCRCCWGCCKRRGSTGAPKLQQGRAVQRQRRQATAESVRARSSRECDSKLQVLLGVLRAQGQRWGPHAAGTGSAAAAAAAGDSGRRQLRV